MRPLFNASSARDSRARRDRSPPDVPIRLARSSGIWTVRSMLFHPTPSPEPGQSSPHAPPGDGRERCNALNGSARTSAAASDLHGVPGIEDGEAKTGTILLRSRVTTVSPCSRAVAAITPSAVLRVVPLKLAFTAKDPPAVAYTLGHWQDSAGKQRKEILFKPPF